MNLTKVGRGGLAGAESAMDGAKRGPQERLLPSPANSSPAAFDLDRALRPHVTRRFQR